MKAYLKVYKSIDLPHLPLKLKGGGGLCDWFNISNAGPTVLLYLIISPTYSNVHLEWVKESDMIKSQGVSQPADQHTSMKENS